jgi:dephospho-CoA kinase
MKLKIEYQRLTPEKRLYQSDIPVIGLTGGIASGKSSVARLLEMKGFTIISADKLVKNIYQWPESITFIQTNFPDFMRNGEIDFKKLREKVFQDEKTKKLIESYIYQRLPEAYLDELKLHSDPSVIIYDVPLLFERGMEKLFDLVLVVYTPRSDQLERLKIRDHISTELAEKMLNQQMDIEDKKNKADVVLMNILSEKELAHETESFVNQYFNLIS